MLDRLKIADSPDNILIVRGGVFGTDDKPVPGIQLVLSSYLKDDILRATPVESKKMLSNSDGLFELQWKNFSTRYIYVLVAEDIDGEENDGEFLSDSIEIIPYSNSPSYDAQHHTYTSEGNFFDLRKK